MGFSRLAEEIQCIEDAGADLLHLDVMDGHFVPNLALSSGLIKSLRPLTQLPFDVHLMLTHPQEHIPAFVEAGADRITVEKGGRARTKKNRNQKKEGKEKINK